MAIRCLKQIMLDVHGGERDTGTGDVDTGGGDSHDEIKDIANGYHGQDDAQNSSEDPHSDQSRKDNAEMQAEVIAPEANADLLHRIRHAKHEMQEHEAKKTSQPRPTKRPPREPLLERNVIKVRRGCRTVHICIGGTRGQSWRNMGQRRGQF